MSAKEREAPTKAADEIAREKLEKEDIFWVEEERKDGKEGKEVRRRRAAGIWGRTRWNAIPWKTICGVWKQGQSCSVRSNPVRSDPLCADLVRSNPVRSQVPSWTMMAFPLMERDPSMVVMHILMNGSNGKNSFITRREGVALHMMDPPMLMMQWFVWTMMLK